MQLNTSYGIKNEINDEKEVKDKNRIVIDWLTIVSLVDSPESMISWLGLSDFNWEPMNGMMGYPYRLSNGIIHILYGGSDEMGVCAVISGQGCRIFEKYGTGDYIELFEDILNDPDHIWITRIDVAYDDFDGLQMQDISRDTQYQNFVSRFQRWTCEMSDSGVSCTFGSPQSMIKLRIYDKLSEQKSKKYMTIECPEDIKTWVRIEIQFRKERAMQMIEVYRKSGYSNIAIVFFGIIAQYHRFVVPQQNDDNKRRWPTAEYWSAFFDRANRIRLFVSSMEQYTIDKAADYVLNQPLGSIKALCEIWGPEDFLKRVTDAPWPRNKKYENLVKMYKGRKVECHYK